MGLDAETVRSDWVGDGSTAVFSYTFRVQSDDQLRVVTQDPDTGIETIKTLTTHYTVQGVGGDSGGTVTFLTAPAYGNLIAIVRYPDVTQEADIRNGGPSYAATLEDVLDRVVMVCQRLLDFCGRGLHIPLSDAPDDAKTLVPAKVGRANRYVAFDESGEIEMRDDAVASVGVAWAREGTLTTASNDRFPPFTALQDDVYTRIDARVATAPTGANVTVDIVMDDITVLGTVTILAGQKYGISTGLEMSVPSGSFVRPQITQVGSSIAGATLAVRLLP